MDLSNKNDYDVICVAEIKPKNTNNPLDDAHIGIAGYFLFTNLQDDPRRGIAVYVKATLLVSRISLNKVLDWVEYLAIEIVLPQESLVLATFYWSPICPNLIESELALCKALQLLQDKKPRNLLIIGDFNLPQVSWVDGLGYSPQYHEGHGMNSAFLNYLAENTLYQSIESPTRFRDGQIPLLLDLAITDNPDQILSIDHLPLIGASDHVCLLTTLQLSPPSSNHICRRYINYEKTCKELRRMQNGDWEALFEHKSSNDSWNLFKEIMLKHEETCTTVSYIKRPHTPTLLDKVHKTGNEQILGKIQANQFLRTLW